MQFINGKLAAGSSNEELTVLNPATGETVQSYPAASDADVDAAVGAAAAAFGEWSRATPGERSDALIRLAGVLRQQADALAEAETIQTGKPIRLSGEFHSLAADLAGNSALARTMRELSVLTCLMIFLYDAPTATCCRDDEHSKIVDAIAKRDAGRAERLMREHLDHIQSSMKLESVSEQVDLEEIFRN